MTVESEDADSNCSTKDQSVAFPKYFLWAILLTHFPSDPINTPRTLSVCPPRRATCLRDRGSQTRMTLSGVPAANNEPDGVVAREYTEAGGLGISTGVDDWLAVDCESNEIGNCVPTALDRPSAKSHILIFRSNPPLATHPASRLTEGKS